MCIFGIEVGPQKNASLGCRARNRQKAKGASVNQKTEGVE